MKNRKQGIIYMFIKTAYVWLLVIGIILIIVLILFVLYPITLIFREKMFGFVSIIIKFLIRLWFFIFVGSNFRIDLSKIVSKQQTDKSRIFVLTHASFFDPLLMYLLPGNLRILVKKKYANIPVLGLIVKMCGGIEVESKSNNFENNQVLNIASKVLQKGCSLVVYPEGTRSRGGQVGRFKNGAFKIAYFSHSQIIPVVIDSWGALKPGGWMIGDTGVVMRALKPIEYEEYKGIDLSDFRKTLRIRMGLELLRIRDVRRRAEKNYYRTKSKYHENDNKEKVRLLQAQKN